MPETEVHCSFSNASTRNKVRTRVIEKFLNEEPGTGTKNLASKYVYYVETLVDGSRIFLKRPAPLNKGFDFIIHIENINFEKGLGRRRRTNPRHGDIFKDIELKKREGGTTEFNELARMIRDVFECKELEDDMDYPHFETGYSAELIIKVVKWFFIEQDITYWNYSGRYMFWNSIKDLLGV